MDQCWGPIVGFVLITNIGSMLGTNIGQTSYYERTSVCLFVCLCVCVFPSPGRIVAPIVVIFGTRVLCRPGKVIGYQKILSLASLAHAAQKKRAAGLQQPVRLLYRSVWRREAPHTSKLMSRRRGVSRARAAGASRARRARASEASKTSARSARVAPQG